MKKNIAKKITQDIFDNLFQNIEYHFRELGMGDVSVNKKMKDLNRIFYDILLKIQNLVDGDKSEINMNIVNKYLIINSKLRINNDVLKEYFEDFYNFCFNLDTKDIIRGKINIIINMAVPKRKTTVSKRNKRRSHHRIKDVNIIEDKKSGEYRLSHHIDLKTGFYKGKKILDI